MSVEFDRDEGSERNVVHREWEELSEGEDRGRSPNFYTDPPVFANAV